MPNQISASSPPSFPFCPNITHKLSDEDFFGIEGISPVKSATIAIAASVLGSEVLDPEAPPLNSLAISCPAQDELFKTFMKTDNNQENARDDRNSGDQLTERENLVADIERVNAGIKGFEDNLKSRLEYCSGIGNIFGNGLAVGEYVDRNERNLQAVRETVSSDNEESAVDSIKHGQTLYKWADLTLLSAVNAWKFYIVYASLNQFDSEHVSEFEKLRFRVRNCGSPEDQALQTDPQMTSLQSRIDNVSRSLRDQRQYLEKRVGINSTKLLISIITSFPFQFLGLAEKATSKFGKCIYRIIKSSVDVLSIQQALALQKEWIFHLMPPVIARLSVSPVNAKFPDNETEIPDPDPHLDPSSATPPAHMRPSYGEIQQFLLDLQKCTDLQQVDQFFNHPNCNLSIKTDPFLKNLNDCINVNRITLEEVHIKLHNHILREEVSTFIVSLEQCSNLDEVQKILDEKSITTIMLPATIERWQSQIQEPRLRLHLVQTYFSVVGKRPWLESSHVHNTLKNRAHERKENINRAASTLILKHILECESKDFPEIVKHFKRLHIDFNSVMLTDGLQGTLPLPPQSKDEWETCITSVEFCQALAAQWVDYQYAIAKQAENGVRQALSSILQVESYFTNFEFTEYNVGIVSAIVQIIFCWMRYTWEAMSSVLSLFVTKLDKMSSPIGIVNLGYPFYPNLEPKLEGLIMCLVRHFFGIKYKSHEYSYEAYQLNMHIRYIELVAMAKQFFSWTQRIALWINIRLVENCIMGLEHNPFEQDKRTIDLNESEELAYQECENEIRKFRTQLAALRLADVKLIMHPIPKDLQAKGEVYDPIENLVDGLGDADFDYFPPSTLTFFKDIFGCELTNENKGQLKKNLEDFFIRSGNSLTSFYQEHRFSTAAPQA